MARLTHLTGCPTHGHSPYSLRLSHPMTPHTLICLLPTALHSRASITGPTSPHQHLSLWPKLTSRPAGIPSLTLLTSRAVLLSLHALLQQLGSGPSGTPHAHLSCVPSSAPSLTHHQSVPLPILSSTCTCVCASLCNPHPPRSFIFPNLTISVSLHHTFPLPPKKSPPRCYLFIYDGP